MHALIAADSFKDALAAPAVCAAIAAGLRQRSPMVHAVEFPLADGGEGTLATLAARLDLRLYEVESVDPLGRPLRAPIGFSRDGSLAVIEAAAVCGLSLLAPAERDPLTASTIGVGRLVAEALRRGATRLVLAVGGTATNDGGMGLAHALGWRFLDARGEPLVPSGAALSRLARVIPPSTSQLRVRVEVLCDVTNPLSGPDGAARVYARQKGASDAAINVLDDGLCRLAECLAVGSRIDPSTPGAGAAGGLGFGAMAFLGAQLLPGIETILNLTRIDDALARADVVITGEGRLDEQTLSGKLIQGIAARAARHGIPVIALCGQLWATHEQLRTLGVTAHCINESATSLEEQLSTTARHLTATAARMPLP